MICTNIIGERNNINRNDSYVVFQHELKKNN